ncbi:MAG TPA: type II secretion system F family protein [Burkholderiaceae bacterium]|nr:type II secretion system F family protein [Burkholderiaceae bacterium]
MNAASAIGLWPVLFAVFAGAAALLGLGTLLGSRFARRHRERFERAVGVRMRESFLFVDTARLFVLQHLAAAAATLAAWVLSGHWQVALAVALAAGAMPSLLLRRLRKRRIEAFRQQMPDLLMLVAGGLRAGSGLGQALAQAAAEIELPARQEIGLLLREQRLGVGLGEALAGLTRRMPIEETTLFASALRIGAESGGSMAATLESLAEAMRRKLAIEGKIRALTAQGRLQAWVMGALPGVLAVLLFLVEPVAMRALVDTWQGWVVSATVLALQAMGVAMIRRIVAIDV